MLDDDLDIPRGLDGRVVRHRVGDVRPRPHRHVELELNLVVRGTSSYLLGERRYELTPGTLAWLFPGQGHVLVDESADHELWWAVFRPDLVTRAATTQREQPLLEADPVGRYSRRLSAHDLRHLVAILEDVRAAQPTDTSVANAGLAYLLILAWRCFRESGDIVAGADLHPSVETVARLIRSDPSVDLTRLAEAASLSPSHLSRLFKAQTGVPITRFRNQQRLERFLASYGRGGRTTALAAALEAGFGSYAQFYRVFRELTGRTPAAIRSSAVDDWSQFG
jgi:AraC-like DNA-binding protein